MTEGWNAGCRSILGLKLNAAAFIPSAAAKISRRTGEAAVSWARGQRCDVFLGDRCAMAQPAVAGGHSLGSIPYTYSCIPLSFVL
jgi:hypothetical protein